MFRNQLAEVLQDHKGHALPPYDEELEKKMTTLSPIGKHVIHPLVPRIDQQKTGERSSSSKVQKRVVQPGEINKRFGEITTRDGQDLLPEKLQSVFALRLADNNALQRLGMPTDFDLEANVAYLIQDAVPTAQFRNPSSRNQSFEANQLSTLTYNPQAISISVKFGYNVMKNHPQRMATYVERMLLSEAGRVIEQISLTGTGTDGQPQGLITAAEASGSAASLVSFPTAGVDVSSLQNMLEDLAGLKSGIEPGSCGWIIGEAVYKTLQGLADPSGKVPLITTQVVGERACKYMLGLPLEVSANMPSGKVLLSNFKQSCRLLFWFPNLDLVVNPFTGNQQIEVVAQQYVNIAIPRPELLVLGS